MRFSAAMAELLSSTAMVLAASIPAPLRPDSWTACGGDWRFSVAALRQECSGYSESRFETTAHLFLRAPALRDFSIEFEFNVARRSPGVAAAEFLFRSTDSRTFCLVQFSSGGHGVYLVRDTRAKHWISIQRRYRVALPRGRWHRVRLTARGPRIRVELDGVPVIRTGGVPVAAGRIGFGSSQAAVAFRNIRLDGVPAAMARPWKDLGGKIPQPCFRRICRDAGAGGYEAFPDICRCANGDLLCVFYAGYAHVSLPCKKLPRGARVCTVRSADDGRTWSRPALALDTPWDDRDPSVCCLRDGTLLCNWFTYYGRFRPPKAGKNFPYKELWLSVSKDNGHTWSKPRRIPQTAGAYWACSSPILELHDGTLLWPIYREYRHPLRNWSAVLRSSDKGRTWSAPIWIDPDNADNDEPALCQLPDGAVLCVMRTNGGDSMWFSRSTDGGRSWTKSAKIGFKGQCPYLFFTSRGVLLLGHRIPGTSLHYSMDGGKTWSRNLFLDACSGAYPSMVELRDGTVLVVYYEEGPGSSIRAQRLKVTRRGVAAIPWE